MAHRASDHPITIEPHGGRVTVSVGGETIVDTRRALRLRESTYAPVLYVPRDDVRMELLSPTDHATHCPYKGDANYFTIQTDSSRIENAVWSYQAPIAGVEAIKNHLAFYRDKVTVEDG